jgi:hypothetical protein
LRFPTPSPVSTTTISLEDDVGIDQVKLLETLDLDREK